MAKGSLMLQLEVIQISAPGVSVPEVWAVAVDSLDGDTTTVREIAAERIGVFQGENLWATQEHSIETAFTELFLVFSRAESPLKVFYAPSHVPSPPFAGAGLVILRVRDFGYEVESPGRLSVGRVIGAHAYLDETT